MRTEETESGYVRLFLNSSEIEQVKEYYSEQPFRRLAIRLQVDAGFRVGEVPPVQEKDLIEQDDVDFYRIKIRSDASKSFRRETIVSKSLAQQIKTISNIKDTDGIFDVTKRTVQNWVRQAGKALAEETGEEDWELLKPHDLRRSWASSAVQSGVSETVIMSLGGWEHHETFQEHYFHESNKKIQEQFKGFSDF